MSAKKAHSKEEASELLEERPVLVLFHMVGCPHCAANQPAWEDAKKKAPAEVKIVEIEAENVPDEEGVTSFPTMEFKDKKGKTKKVAGAQPSGDAILGQLGVRSGGSRRRRVTRRLTNRRQRKLRNRTLRNYVALAK